MLEFVLSEVADVHKFNGKLPSPQILSKDYTLSQETKTFLEQYQRCLEQQGIFKFGVFFDHHYYLMIIINPWNSRFSPSTNNFQRELVCLVVTWAISNITSANIFLSQIDFIKVLMGDVVLVSRLVNPKQKKPTSSCGLSANSYALWRYIIHVCSFLLVAANTATGAN